MNLSLPTRLLLTGTVAIFVWSLLFWDYTHGGVPAHHLFAREDMPSFSNWWGGLLIPALTWLAAIRVKQRTGNEPVPNSVIYSFIGALCYAILLSLAFEFSIEDVPLYLLLGIVASSLFLPIYRAEYFLGLVLGMVYTFGGVLPVIIVLVLSVVGLVAYKGIRRVVLFGVRRIRG